MPERKSLLARFDEEHIIKVATASDNDERLYVTFHENEKDNTYALSLNGGYDTPKATATIINNSGDTVTFTSLWSNAEYGAGLVPVTIASGETKNIESCYFLRKYGSGPKWVVDLEEGSTSIFNSNASEYINCEKADGSRWYITNPEKDAFLGTITLT